MTRIPDEELLEIYESLRPGRSTYYRLLSLSQQVASRYDAEHTGAYIREAADAYRDTGRAEGGELTPKRFLPAARPAAATISAAHSGEVALECMP